MEVLRSIWETILRGLDKVKYPRPTASIYASVRSVLRHVQENASLQLNTLVGNKEPVRSVGTKRYKVHPLFCLDVGSGLNVDRFHTFYRLPRPLGRVEV
jgi:hypothetical protein